MESPNPQGIPILKIQSHVPRKHIMEVLVPGMEETAVRMCIPGSHSTLQPYSEAPVDPKQECSSLKTGGPQCPESLISRHPNSKSPSPKRTPNPKTSISST